MIEKNGVDFWETREGWVARYTLPSGSVVLIEGRGVTPQESEELVKSTILPALKDLPTEATKNEGGWKHF